MQRLIVFGGLSITTEDGPLTGRAVQRRRLALLAMLAAAAQRGASRDKLIAFLWPAADAETGRHYLSDSVYRINSAMGGDVIIATGDDLRLDPHRLPTDLADFEDALARSEYERAVSIYAGPFLDGFFLPDAPEVERWIDEQRARLAAACAKALESLADAATRHGDHAAAAAWWRRLAGHDPYNSRVALRLMHALAAAGERAAAIQHARIHEALLRGELEVEPDPAIVAFAEQLRNEKQPEARAAQHSAVNGSSAPSTAAPLPGAERETHAARLAADAAENGAVSPSAGSPRRAPRIAAAVGLAAVALVAWLGTRASDGDPVATGEPMQSVAVLPFANLSDEPGTDYFSDGMTDELIATLGTVEGIDVASRTSVFAYKGQALDVREIGRKLGVDAVVEGSVRKSGRTLRITAQLVSTGSGYRLWSDAYDREVADALTIQEEIARSIVTKMTGVLVGTADTVTPARTPRDAEAYDLYLRGRYAWHQRSREGLSSAIDFFQRAVDRAPTYARAHAGLGDAYAVSAFYDYRAPRDAYPKAEAAARRALEIDPHLAAARATLGYILTYYHLDWPRAEEEFERALEADPNYSTAHQWYANLLTVGGRFDEAERAMRRAQEADPLSLIASAALGWSQYYAGKYDAALEQSRKTLALAPTYAFAHLWGGWALDARGEPREAREWIRRAVQLSPGNDLVGLSYAYVLARSDASGGRDSAQAIVREIERRAAAGAYVPSYEIAKVHLALGERGDALRWLARAVEEKSHSRAFLRVDPQLRPLRGDPLFEALVARVFRRDAVAVQPAE